jgi:hypothetical protein
MTSIEWLLQEMGKFNNNQPTEAMIMYAKKLHEQELYDAYEEGYNRVVKVIEDATQRNILKK